MTDQVARLSSHTSFLSCLSTGDASSHSSVYLQAAMITDCYAPSFFMTVWTSETSWRHCQHQRWYFQTWRHLKSSSSMFSTHNDVGVITLCLSLTLLYSGPVDDSARVWSEGLMEQCSCVRYVRTACFSLWCINILTLSTMVPFWGSQCCLKSSFSLSLDTVDFLRLNTQTTSTSTQRRSADIKQCS